MRPGSLQQLLVAVTRALAKADSLRDAAPPILKAVCEALGCEVGLLWTVDPATDELRLLDLWRRPAALLEPFEAASRRCTFPRSVGLPGRVWATGKPAWISDGVDDRELPRAQAAATSGLRAAFAFPVRLGDAVLGVLELFAAERTPPDDELLDAMESIGCQLGQLERRCRAEAALAQKGDEHAVALAALQEANARIAALATTDGLTGVANRRAFQERLAILSAEAGRGRAFALVSFDLDRFKELNDSQGHQAGDTALVLVARSVRERVRRVDLVARFGGDEFAVLLVDATEELAARVAEELRRRIAALPVAGLAMTASFGVCAAGPGLTSAEEIVKAADEALHEAKRLGRDRVACHGALRPPGADDPCRDH